jgi:aryl-alcohol dehydrogenase-like predicted oxidoreductase
MSLTSYVTLGRSGLRVSPFALGTMTFGEDWGWGASVADSEAMLSAYLDRGGNFIDTANIYTNGHSEVIIGNYFASRKDRRDRAVIGTKFYGSLHDGDPNGGGAGRKALMQQCEASLRRLRTDVIDLYWLHNWDPRTPIEETLRTLDDLIASGKIRHVGFSDLPAWVVAEAQTIAEFRNWTPAIALQLEYSLLERTSERELIPMALDFGLGVVPWSPLKNGFLSGKYRRGQSTASSGRAALVGGPADADYDVIEAVVAIADEIGATPAAVALAWINGRPGVASTLVGARSVAQLEANFAALDLVLDEERRARLEALSAPSLGFPQALYREFAPALGFPNTTIDGRRYGPSPVLQPGAKIY